MSNEKDKKIGSFEVGDASNKFREIKTAYQYDPKAPKIIPWVIKYSGGLVKDEKTANYTLIGFIAVTMIATLLLLAQVTRSPSPPANKIIDIAAPKGEH